MDELPDLESREQIAELVRRFYAQVAADDLLGPVFVDQAAVDWSGHLPKITAFWCLLEHGQPGFSGSPTEKHTALSAVSPFRAEQFTRWVELFHGTVDGGWAGPHADSIKSRAVVIAQAQSRSIPGAEPWGGIDDHFGGQSAGQLG